MKIYERLGERGYHTSIATTFGIDFDAYETIALPRLRGAGCNNNILLVDDAMLSQALSEGMVLPRHAGRQYTASGLRSRGVFHPKLFLQLGRKGGRMLVSSANITVAGLGGNVELAGEMHCDATDSGEQRLIAQAWRYVSQITANCGLALKEQVHWMRTRTPWLRDAEPQDRAVTLLDKTQAALLTANQDAGIASRFVEFVDDGPVNRLIVVSPYWDDRLEALRFISKALSVERVDAIIDPNALTFPKQAVEKLPWLRLYDCETLSRGRFLHAKLLIAQTRSFDHVLFGSANCTIAALGNKTRSGLNDEVCLYRRFPADTAATALKLNDLLSRKSRIEPDTLKPPVKSEDLDVEGWRERNPGRFEWNFDVLSWMPPNNCEPDRVRIDLLNVDGIVIPCTLIPLSPNEGLRQFSIRNMTEPPAFARLQLGKDEVSALAIIAAVDKVRETAREARSKAVEEAARRLSDEAEEGLWLMECFEILEPTEQRSTDHDKIGAKKRKSGREEEEGPGEEYRILNYADFVSGRRHREEASALERSSLAGNELSMVRGFMNRILGISVGGADQEDNEQTDAPSMAFNLGDEVQDGEKTLERGANEELEIGKSNRLAEKQKQEEEWRRKRAEQKAGQAEIVYAVETFLDRLAECKDTGPLASIEVLRLRVLLMIIAGAGHAGTSQDEGRKLTSLQVLPVEGGDNPWPQLLGRILFGFFGGNDPLLQYLAVDHLQYQMPDDILESWATCFWAVQAVVNAAKGKAAQKKFLPFFTPIAQRVYLRTGLTYAELCSDRVVHVMGRMSDRFCSRLGLNAESVRLGHENMAKQPIPQNAAK
jgi:hypothetical protein